MRLTFAIHYHAQWGEALYISGEGSTLGLWDEDKACPLTCAEGDIWRIELDLPEPIPPTLSYSYLVRNAAGQVSRREGMLQHHLDLPLGASRMMILEAWLQSPEDAPSYTTALLDTLRGHRPSPLDLPEGDTPYLCLQTFTSSVGRGRGLYLVGSTSELGAWDTRAALPMRYLGRGRWGITLPLSALGASGEAVEYKYFVAGEEGGEPEWEEGANRALPQIALGEGGGCTITDGFVRLPSEHLRLAGCVVPLFALRGEQDWGIGDFGTLHELVDLVHELGMNALQLLPINDTTFARSPRDSYPYNAISVDALHPIYLDLSQLPALRDAELQRRLEEAGAALRVGETVDYPRVIQLKEAYLRQLFAEQCAGDGLGGDFEAYRQEQERWLEPYAYYCLLRDRHEGLPPTEWGRDSHYDLGRLRATYSGSEELHLLRYCQWVQWLLHLQLCRVRDHARALGIFLKGDLPIGVSPHGVEVWTTPELFHLEQSAGAPPDDFAVDGQNWGFPTYDWAVMQQDQFLWWRRRMERLATYFDALRIDHVLGFFRIWEVPRSERSGLLGHFHPALPYTLGEWQAMLGEEGLVSLLTHPLIHINDLHELLGREQVDNLLASGLLLPTTEPDLYQLSYTSQQDYERAEVIEAVGGGEVAVILSSLCTETALIEDPYTGGYHPRIAWERSRLYGHWDETLQKRWMELSHDYYYRRHDELFRATGLHRLSSLARHSGILLCAEDLGMTPATVPAVLDELQILSLELERMPKGATPTGWADPLGFPYRSIGTTSTHDMASLRGWWHSLSEERQGQYLTQELGRSPEEVSALRAQEEQIYRLILQRHLAAPSLGVLLPLADWMSIDPRLWIQSPEQEQINHPEQADQYWCYRLPLSADQLRITAPQWRTLVRRYIHDTSRLHSL